MGVDLNWGIAQQQPNLAGGFLQSYQAGKQLGMEQRRQNALAAFAANPSDPSSVNALMAVDPEAGMRLQQYQRQEQLRTGLSGAYDTNTGTINPAKVREAYVGAGDVAGAMQFDQQQRAEQLAKLDALHKVNEFGLQLLGSVTDQNSYDAAKAQAQQLYQQYGVPFPDLPPVYNPGVVQALQMRSLTAKDQLEMAMKRAAQEETARHNRTDEATAGGRLAVEQGRLKLGQAAEARVAKNGGGSGVQSMSTADLLKIAGGN